MIDRVILVVLDSCGVGELPDADVYGDRGSNTLGNLARVVGGLNLPNFERLGLGNITNVLGVDKLTDCSGAWGRMAEVSEGKDTTTGHWEMMGLITAQGFPVYPHGFPADVIEAFEKAIGRPILGNKAASGTGIIDELGAEHMETGYPIVYTSADSVFQVAAHEEVIPVEELYDICRKAREILQGEHGVARVIARPFVGRPGAFVRTERRHDFSLEPPGPTVLDCLIGQGRDVTAVGKISDIFLGRGVTRSITTSGNTDGLRRILELIKSDHRGLVFVNLVDFDMQYGHRNDPEGYARALAEVDTALPGILASLRDEDVLILTADHGCDPTTESTDHSREYVPVLVAGRAVKPGTSIGTRKCFSDLGKTVAELLNIDVSELPGESFAGDIINSK